MPAAEGGMADPPPGTGGTVAHRLMSTLPDTETLLPGGPLCRLAVPLGKEGAAAGTSASVQLRLVPSFSVEESSSESSNMRSCSGLRGEAGEMDLNFLGPGRLLGLDSSPDDAPLDSRDLWGL